MLVGEEHHQEQDCGRIHFQKRSNFFTLNAITRVDVTIRNGGYGTSQSAGHYNFFGQAHVKSNG